MGMYVNPGNAGFAGILSGEYVDKTGLIALVNAAIGTPNKLVCSTRPRRFGKTFAAESLVAYYTRGADSRSLFEGLDISRDPSFEKHLNAYNVIHLDMTAFRGAADVVYLPRRGDPAPALVVELKWDRSPKAAIAQVRDRDYPAVLRSWGGPILLVGITYECKSKRHVCRIEEA